MKYRIINSAQMVKTLKKGIDVPYMFKDNNGHDFRVEEKRFDFSGAVEQYFFKHLGGRFAELKEEKNYLLLCHCERSEAIY